MAQLTSSLRIHPHQLIDASPTTRFNMATDTARVLFDIGIALFVLRTASMAPPQRARTQQHMIKFLN